ncbi:MAG: hypothetical protein L0922_07175, partial [Candidatus Mariimomonas ferrooxydans]
MLLSLISSIPIINPLPRTSPTKEYFSLNSIRLFISSSPRSLHTTSTITHPFSSTLPQPSLT